MYPSVQNVTPLEDYKLCITFDTGEEGVLDIRPYLHVGVFQQLRDYREFERVRVLFDAVAWECGLDLDPEFVHAHCVMSAKTVR